MEHLGIHLSKGKNLHSEHYKTLPREITDLNKWKNIPHSRTERFNSLKVAIFPKLIYRFSITLTKVQMSPSQKLRI